MKTKRISLSCLIFLLIASIFCFVTAITMNTAHASVDTTDKIAVYDGMSLRGDAPEGLRFQADLGYSEQEYAEAGITETGMVLLPASKVSGELSLDSASRLKIVTERWADPDDEDSMKFYSVLIASGADEFPEAFYNTPISARAYLKIGDNYYYSTNTVTRSMGYVATVLNALGAKDEVVSKIVAKTTKSVTVAGGSTLDYTAGAKQAAFTIGGMSDVNQGKVSAVWSVTSGDSVTVNSETGEVTPVKRGNATITVTLYYDGVATDVSESLAITVTVPDRAVAEDYFALKQTDNDGEIINNDYDITLADGNISAVTLGGNALTEDTHYTLDGTTLTVLNAAFSGLDNGASNTLSVICDTETLTVTYGKVATFAVTKASDINTGSDSVVAPMMVAGGVSSKMSNPASENSQWRGYFILVNDIDFGDENIVHKCMTSNAYGGAGWGLNGTFDGLGHTFSNFQIRGTNVSFFGRIDFYGSVKNTNFVNFRTSGDASFGLFDSTCYGLLDKLYIDGTCDSTANGGSLLGVFTTYSGNGARLTNSTIYVRTGEATESAYGAIGRTSTFISTSGTTLYTNYAVPATFAAAGGTVLPLNGGDYYALKVAADDTEGGDVVANNFVKTSLEGTLTSVTLYGRNANAVDLTSSATLTSGTFTIPASALSSYTGRGISIKVVTSANTYWYYQDIATYAITRASDFRTTSFDIPKFAKACGLATRNSNWSGYIILANNVDFNGGAIYNALPSANWGDTGKFGGTIDGRGYSLSNFSLAGNMSSWRSLFGSSNSSAVYKNLNITGYTRGSGLIGGLFEYCSALIDNVYIDCTISGNETEGSMFGWVQASCRVTNSTIIARDGNAARIMMISAEGTYTNSTIYTNADKSAKVDGATYTWGGAFKAISELPA